jgi:ABC-type Fe3+-hydroxamate transport system substrate-binding protein
MRHTDQLGRAIVLDESPRTIVSIVPSQTELLYHLGLEPAGQTIFCIKPEHRFAEAQKVGGTKKLQLDKIHALKPDIIIGNKEENDQGQIEELEKHYPVWMSDIYSLRDAQNMIKSIGEIFQVTNRTDHLLEQIDLEFQKMRQVYRQPLRVLYLIWQEPFIAVGRNTFINSLLQEIKWDNVMQGPQTRYPEITHEEIIALAPDLILLSSEPFPFKEIHRENVQNIFPNSKVVLVDGEAFSWYGSRMLFSPKYLMDLSLSISS